MRNTLFVFLVLVMLATTAAAQVTSLQPKGYCGFPINGGGPWAVKTIDLHEDGDQDLIVLRAHEYDEVYINDGTGKFTRRAWLADWQILGGSFDVAEADVNGDEIPDLIMGRGPASGGSDTLNGQDMILVRETDSTFAYRPNNFQETNDVACNVLGQWFIYPANLTNYSMGVGVGDFNEDERVDVVFANGGIIYQINIAPIKPFDGQWIFCPALRNELLENDLYFGRDDGTGSWAPPDGVLDFEDVGDTSGIGSTPDVSTDVAVGDFNGDDHLDIFFTSFHHFDLTGNLGAAANQCKLYINDENNLGFFSPSSGFPDDLFPATSAAAHDFDHDGDLDLFITMDTRAKENLFTSYDIQPKLFVNDGQGNFTDSPDKLPELEGCHQALYDAVFVDVNDDGWEDIFCGGVENALLMLDPTDTTFTDRSDLLPQWANSRPNAFHAYGVAAEDLNGDERPDFVMVDTYEQNRIQFQLENGSYRDTTTTNLAPDGENNTDVAFADLDHDGDPDIVASIYEDCAHLQSVHLNMGFSACDAVYFEDASEIFPSSIPKALDRGVTVADLNNDQLPEVLFTGYDEPRLYRNDGALNFTEVTSTWGAVFANETKANKARFVDIEDDGSWEVFFPNGKISVNGGAEEPASDKLFRWDGNQFVDDQLIPQVPKVTVSADFADINDDGWLDILAVNTDDTMCIYLSDAANGTFERVIPTGFVDNEAGDAKFADLNNDELMDIVEVTACCPGGNNSVLNAYYINQGLDGNGVPVYTRTEFGTPSFQGSAVSVKDINFDEHPDVFIADRGDIRIYLWENNTLVDHTSGYTDVNEISGSAMSGHAMAWADIDGNGLEDLFIARDNQDLLFYADGTMPVNVTELLAEDPFSIYPNPTDEMVRVKFSGTDRPKRLTVFDLQGRIVMRQPFQTDLNVSQLDDGIYFIQIGTDKNHFTKRIVKQ